MALKMEVVKSYSCLCTALFILINILMLHMLLMSTFEETCWKNNGQRKGDLKNWIKTTVKIGIEDDMISGF